MDHAHSLFIARQVPDCAGATHKLQGFHSAATVPGDLPARLESVAAAILSGFQSDYSILLHDREHLKKPENLARVREAFFSEMFGPLEAIMEEGLRQGSLKDESAHLHTLVFLGILSNFIGRADALGLDNATLARKLTRIFLEGSSQS